MACKNFTPKKFKRTKKANLLKSFELIFELFLKPFVDQLSLKFDCLLELRLLSFLFDAIDSVERKQFVLVLFKLSERLFCSIAEMHVESDKPSLVSNSF